MTSQRRHSALTQLAAGAGAGFKLETVQIAFWCGIKPQLMSVIPTDNVFLELILPVKNPALIRIGNIVAIDGLQVISDSDYSNASEKE